MKFKNSEKDLQADFQDFINTKPVVLPAEISQPILTSIAKKLNPSSWMVFAKAVFLQLVVGTLSLGICDQFSMNPFPSEFSLANYFMHFGHSTCMVLCGVLFIGLSLSVSRLLYTNEEFKVFKRNSLLQVFCLTTFSLMAFAAFGAELVLGIAAFWFFGAMLGGLIVVNIPVKRFV